MSSLLETNVAESENYTSVDEIKDILTSYCSDVAFLLGNGINRYYKNDSMSWENLLLFLWNKYSKKNIELEEIEDGISFTEFYDAIEIQNYNEKQFSSKLQKEVKEKMSSWLPDLHQNKIIDKIIEFDAPILTTNFEDLIPKSRELKLYRLGDKFTHHYPWGCYYGNRELENPTDGFGVWFPNGMIKYHTSIKLGLSQYMGNVERARKMIHAGYENNSFVGKNQNEWIGYDTWLHIIFNKSLFILGLGLEENEVFMRWLLIERAKYYRKYPERKKEGWYVTKKETSSKNHSGKKFFLESVGIKMLEVEDYDVQFEKIWE